VDKSGKVMVRFIGEQGRSYPAIGAGAVGSLGAILDAALPRTKRERELIRLTALRLVYAALSISHVDNAKPPILQ
jgi:hypothetical protein